MNIIQRALLRMAGINTRKDITELIRLGLSNENESTARNYIDYVNEGYKTNPVVYACIRQIQNSLTALNFVILDNGEPIPNDAAVPPAVEQVRSLLQRPNPQQAFPEFIKLWVTQLLLGGTTYIETSGLGIQQIGLRERAKGSPEFWLVRPDRVTIRFKGRELLDYVIDQHQPEQHVLKPDSMFHIKMPNPGKEMTGTPPLQSAIMAILSLNDALKFNRNLLKNAAVPALLLLLKTTKLLDRASRKAIEQEFNEQYRGTDNAGGVIVQNAESSELHELSKTPRDMMWSETHRESMRHICAVLGVPSVLLGDPTSRTYSNMQAAQEDMYINTTLPLGRLYISEKEHYLWPILKLSDTRYGLDIDTSDVPALSENTDSLYGRLKSADWLSINDKRELTDHERVEMPDADTPGALMQKPAISAPAGERKKRAAVIDFPNSIYPTMQSRAAAIETFDRLRRKYDGEIRSLMLAHWREQKRKVERVLQGQLVTASGNGGYQKRFNEDEIAAQIDALMSGEADILAEKMTPLVRGIIIDFGALGMSEVKPGGFFNIDDFDVSNKIAIDLRERARLIETITSADELKDIIRAGFDEGQGMGEITSRILDKYSDWEDYRAERIARTETNHASSQGTLEGYKQAGVAGKEWLTARDAKVRHAHEELDGDIVALDGLFSADGYQTQAPGLFGVAGQDINCRCRIAPVVASEMPGGGL